MAGQKLTWLPSFPCREEGAMVARKVIDAITRATELMMEPGFFGMLAACQCACPGCWGAWSVGEMPRCRGKSG